MTTTIQVHLNQVDPTIHAQTQGAEEMPSYVIELQKLAAHLLTVFGNISKQDHTANEEMKKKYSQASNKSAELQNAYGITNRNTAIGSCALFVLGLGIPNADDKNVVRLVSEQLPQLFSMSTTKHLSDKQEWDGKRELELQKISAKTAKESGDSGKQGILNLLNTLEQLVKSASHGN